ncbi:MAG: SLATT domain-containing protein [Nitrospirae bacterium]|nr:SLATT domain-containing protein [Nitrospirota bacterium]
MSLKSLGTFFMPMNELSNKIWVTRKSRIYAENRLLHNEKFSYILMIWYSLFLVFLSIWSLKRDNYSIDIFLLSASVAVLVSSVFLYSQRYSERAMRIRQCYIKLDELASRAMRAEENKDTALLESIHNEYSNVLLNVENHIDFDYLCFRFSKRNDAGLAPSFQWQEKVTYYFEVGRRVTLKVFLLLLPLIVLSFYFYG